MFNKDIIVLDIETTGFSVYDNDIIEIAAVKLNGSTLEEEDSFSYLVNIDGDIPQAITSLTGITKDMTLSGSYLKDVLDELSSFCSDLDIYAHYSPFDKKFLRHNLDVYGVPFSETNWIDTISVFKRKWPSRKTYKLESLILDFNLASHEDHRALSDARHTASLIRLCK